MHILFITIAFLVFSYAFIFMLDHPNVDMREAFTAVVCLLLSSVAMIVEYRPFARQLWDIINK